MTPAPWRDEPISSLENDTLDRGEYAGRLARLIATTHSWDGSAVFGLTGPWGSGKTSLIRLIIEELGTMDPEHVVVWFTPWAAHNVNGVLADFYTALFTALPKKVGKKAKDSFATLLRVAAPAGSLIPVGGAVATAAMNITAEALGQAKPWDVAFKEVSDQIAKGKRKILVVVDDIDRLQGDELLTVLKVIRLLGRFPGVQYLLAYDHDSLTHTLETAGAARSLTEASRYIEKIVQYPAPVPALVGVQLMRRLNVGLDEVIKRRRPLLAGQRLHRTSDLLPTMRRLLTTPRAIDRYLAQLDYELGLHHPGEVDDEDVIALVLLRTTMPTLFARLPRYELELVSGQAGHEWGTTRVGDGVDSFAIEDLTADMTLTAEELRAATELLYALFPKLRNSAGGINPRRGIGSKEYFRRYFAMGILADHDIPDHEVLEALRRTFSGNGDSLRSLLSTDDVYLAELAFAKIQENYLSEIHRVTDSTRDTAALELMATLGSVVDPFPNSGVFFWGLSDQIPRWMGQHVLPSLSDDTDSDALLSNLEVQTIRACLTMLRVARSRVEGRPAWWEQVHASMLPRVQAEFLDHLRQRDSAPDSREDLIRFFVDAAGAGVDLGPVRAAIADAIANGDFGIADLAARFVTMEGTGSSFSHRQADFDLIAPRESYPWYAETSTFPHGGDWSWSDRRAAATQLISRPPE